MIPKSTVKMRFGDFCFVPRDDGRFALFIYICPQEKSRSYFHGALATSLVEVAQLDAVPSEIEIGEHALVHVQCFRENSTPISGNLGGRLSQEVFSRVSKAVHSVEIGSKHRVWGHKTIVRYANTIQD